jgi:RNA polymerase sigma-70 factor (ECF subfamily)
VSAKCGTFDECLISDAFLERALRRLDGLTSETLEQLRSVRPASASAGSPALMKRSTRESEEREDIVTDRLVARSKSGDAAAMECLIQRYQPRVAGFALACVGDGQVLDDLCQTIFYKMIVGLRRLEEDEKFEAWLFRIARNACFDHLRRHRLRRIFVPWQREHDQFASPPDPTGDHRIDAFRRALKMLPRKQRELVALLQDDKLTYEELAAITKSSVSSVRSRLFRARRQLRKSMRDDG